MSTVTGTPQTERLTSSPVQDPSVSFAEVVLATHRHQRQMRGSDKEVPERDAGYLRALRSFEASQGRILSAFWGSNLPIGVALTETRASRVKRWLGAAPGVNLHRSVDGIDLPAEVEAALADGDLLALKASGVLRDPSRRVVLERVMSAQRYFLSIIDSSRGDMPRPADIREKAATP